MSNLGVFEVVLWINGKKYTHLLNMINELNNIFGLDFVQVHKLKYDVNSRQAKFLVQIQMPFQQLNRQFYLPWLQQWPMQDLKTNATEKHG